MHYIKSHPFNEGQTVVREICEATIRCYR